MSITITLHYRCSGCMKTEDCPSSINREFRSFSGRDYGLGVWHFAPVREIIEESAPEGWVAFDPWTNVTYCAECWASILAPESEQE